MVSHSYFNYYNMRFNLSKTLQMSLVRFSNLILSMGAWQLTIGREESTLLPEPGHVFLNDKMCQDFCSRLRRCNTEDLQNLGALKPQPGE